MATGITEGPIPLQPKSRSTREVRICESDPNVSVYWSLLGICSEYESKVSEYADEDDISEELFYDVVTYASMVLATSAGNLQVSTDNISFLASHCKFDMAALQSWCERKNAPSLNGQVHVGLLPISCCVM